YRLPLQHVLRRDRVELRLHDGGTARVTFGELRCVQRRSNRERTPKLLLERRRLARGSSRVSRACARAQRRGQRQTCRTPPNPAWGHEPVGAHGATAAGAAAGAGTSAYSFRRSPSSRVSLISSALSMR